MRTLTVIHLFNDPIAILFLHAAVNMFLDNKWSLGSVFFSLGVSVKMNILLYAPALLCLYLNHLSLTMTLVQLTICAVVQLLLAAPFLTVAPLAYLTSAFNLTRSFLHRDSVNFAFLPRSLFLSRGLHLTLLVLHIAALVFSNSSLWYVIDFLLETPAKRFFVSTVPSLLSSLKMIRFSKVEPWVKDLEIGLASSTNSLLASTP